MSLQPHEVHIPYVMQFFVDHSIYGMDLIYFSRIQFKQRRRKEGEEEAQEEERDEFRAPTPRSLSQHQWTAASMAGLLCSEEAVTTCAVEARASRRDILNPVLSQSQDDGIRNPGLRFLWTDERARDPSSDFLRPLSSPPREPSLIPVAETELFHRAQLDRWLADAAESPPDSLNSLPEEPAFVVQTPVAEDEMDASLSLHSQSLDQSVLEEMLEGLREERVESNEFSQTLAVASPTSSLPLSFSQDLNVAGESRDCGQADPLQEEEGQLDFTQSVSFWQDP